MPMLAPVTQIRSGGGIGGRSGEAIQEAIAVPADHRHALGREAVEGATWRRRPIGQRIVVAGVEVPAATLGRAVAPRIEVARNRDLAIELVARDEPEDAGHPAARLGCRSARSSR